MQPYYTAIIPYTDTMPTAWHPTDRDFAPLTRGAFPTLGACEAWVAENLGPDADYGVKRMDEEGAVEIVRVANGDEVEQGASWPTYRVGRVIGCDPSGDNVIVAWRNGSESFEPRSSVACAIPESVDARNAAEWMASR